jgi:hypothetical protein
MAITKSITVPLILLLASCVGTQGRTPNTVFNATDDAGHHRFVLTMQNLSRHQICVSPSYWPNDKGYIPETSAKISVNIGDATYPLSTFDEFCPDCVFKIPPKGKITGYLSYDAFVRLAPTSDGYATGRTLYSKTLDIGKSPGSFQGPKGSYAPSHLGILGLR